MKKSKLIDLVTGIVLMVFSCAYFILSFFIPLHKGVPSPRLVPQLTGAAVFILSALLTGSAVKARKSSRHAETAETASSGAASAADGEPAPNYRRVALTLVFLAIYCFCFQRIGFLISSFALLFGQMYLLADEQWRKKRTVLMLIISAVVAIGLYLVFRYAFNVMLPAGILKGIL